MPRPPQPAGATCNLLLLELDSARGALVLGAHQIAAQPYLLTQLTSSDAQDFALTTLLRLHFLIKMGACMLSSYQRW